MTISIIQTLHFSNHEGIWEKAIFTCISPRDGKSARQEHGLMKNLNREQIRMKITVNNAT